MYLEDVLIFTFEDNNLFDVKINGHKTNSSDYFNVQPRRLTFSMFKNNDTGTLELPASRLDTGLSKYELKYYQDGNVEMTGRIDLLKTKSIYKTGIITFTAYDNLIFLKRTVLQGGTEGNITVKTFVNFLNNYMTALNATDSSINLSNETNANLKSIYKTDLEIFNKKEIAQKLIDARDKLDIYSVAFNRGFYYQSVFNKNYPIYVIVGKFQGTINGQTNWIFYIKAINFYNNICYDEYEYFNQVSNSSDFPEAIEKFDTLLSILFNVDSLDELLIALDNNRYSLTIPEGTYETEYNLGDEDCLIQYTGNILNLVRFHCDWNTEIDNQRKALMLMHDWITYCTKDGVITVKDRNPATYNNAVEIADADLIDSKYTLQAKVSTPVNQLSPLAGDLTILEEIITEETAPIFENRNIINVKIDDKNYGLDLMDYVKIREKYYQIQGITHNRKQYDDSIMGVQIGD